MRSPYYIDQDANPAVLSTKKAIEHALHEEGISLTIPTEHTGVTGFYEDNLKVNKLAYALIDSFDMPAVRTWYKYGQYEPYDQLRPKSLDIGPVSKLDEYVHSGWRKDVTVGDLVDALRGYELKKIFNEMGLFEFLVENYQGWAPNSFKKIYLASTEIIQILESLNNASIEQVMANISDWRERIKEASMSLRYWIKNSETFPEAVFNRVEAFLSLFEDSLIAIETSQQLSENKYRVLSKARKAYHENVWQFAAMSISLEELAGPDDEVADYRRRGRDISNELEENSETYLRGWKDELSECGLTPSIDDRRSLIHSDREMASLFDAGITSQE